MRMMAFIVLTLASLAVLSFAAVWTFLWMPAAFEATDTAIHNQVRWGYVHGGVLALIGTLAAWAAFALRPAALEE